MPTVAEVVAQTLVAYGTDTYFCLTGGDHDLWIALHDAGIRIVNCRSEKAAAYMADGYARVSGKPGFVYGQRGPGVANVSAGLPDPFWAMSPVISLTSSIALRARDRYEYQDVDGFEMHRPVTRWNRALQVPQRAADMVRAAIRIATGPVPGPVHLEIAADMLALDAGDSRPYREEELGRVNGRRLAADPALVEAFLDRLLEAERPLIVAGNGVIISEAWEPLRSVAEALDIPVASTLGGKGAIADDHNLAVGVIGRYSRRVANETVRAADTILAVGTQLGGLATYGYALPFAEKRILHIDTDHAAIGQNFRTELGMVADARRALEALREAIARRGAKPRATGWAQQVSQRVAEWRGHAARLAEERPADGIHPAAVLAALRKVMAPQDLLCADTGAIAAWAGTLFPVPAGRSMVRSTGSLGWVVPGAMGAALANPARRTVALSGDGGLLYHIGELETAIRCNIPVVVVVLNNRSFASEHHLLERRWGRTDIPEVVDFHDADFAAVARGFGAHGVRVDDAADIEAALREAMAENRPALVDVRVSKETGAPGENFRGDSPV